MAWRRALSEQRPKKYHTDSNEDTIADRVSHKNLRTFSCTFSLHFHRMTPNFYYTRFFLYYYFTTDIVFLPFSVNENYESLWIRLGRFTFSEVRPTDLSLPIVSFLFFINQIYKMNDCLTFAILSTSFFNRRIHNYSDLKVSYPIYVFSRPCTTDCGGLPLNIRFKFVSAFIIVLLIIHHSHTVFPLFRCSIRTYQSS